MNAFQEQRKLWLLISGHHYLPLLRLYHRWEKSRSVKTSVIEFCHSRTKVGWNTYITKLAVLNKEGMMNWLQNANPLIQSIINDVKVECVVVPTKELNVYADSKSWDIRRLSIRSPLFAYIASIHSLILQNQCCFYCEQYVHVPKNDLRVTYHIVSAREYWKLSGLHQDRVMNRRNFWNFSAPRQDKVMLWSPCNHCPESDECVWFATVKCFLTIVLNPSETHKFAFGTWRPGDPPMPLIEWRFA